jgi:TPR repeat protein
MTRLIGAISGPLVTLVFAVAAAGGIHASEGVQGAGASLTESNPIEKLRKDADLGNERAQYALGCCYNGEHGFTRDSVEAAKWWGKAAAGGLADAQYCLGLSYYLGQGVPKDAAEAANWWRKAADQDHADAQYFLGLSYSAGRGVPKDRLLAIYWLRKSAKLGNKAALEALRKAGPPQD